MAERRPDPATQPQTEPSETTSRADVSEAPQAWELHVSVRGPGGKPYPGALVRFLDGLGSEIARADTSADGEARIHARGSGRAVVTRVQPYLPARSDLLETPPSGERRIVLTVAGGTLAVAGRIFDADGRAPVDALVSAKLAAPPEWVGEWRWAGNPVRNPGEKGTFRIEGLTPGRYLLVMRLSHHAQTEGRPPATPIEVEAGDENVLIRLEAVTWLTFRWIDAVTGKPVATRRQVFQKRGDEEVPFATASGPAGGLPSTKDFRPGSRLVFQARAEGYHPSEPIKLVLDPIERHREIVFRLRPDSDAMAELELVLRDSRGDPVRDIAIMRVFKDSAFGTVHRTEDGRVVLSLPTGTNKLRFGPLLPDRRRLDRPWIVREVSSTRRTRDRFALPMACVAFSHRPG